MNASKKNHNALVERLKASPFYQICQDSFRKSTGLPLVIISSDAPDFNPCHTSPNQNPFCRLLNTVHGNCEECISDQKFILNQSTEKSYTHNCFAGLKETSVPLRLGNVTIGYLKTGQIFTSKPSKKEIAALHDVLTSSGYSEAEQQKVLDSYEQTPFLDKDKYGSMITLLNIVSLQLTELLNRILLESQSEEPEVIRKAKAFLADNVDEKITLERIAKEVNVSTYYFCKLFKQTTGMRFTEYANRYRIELAKNELKNTEKPVTDIAYEVGFQSLSQFNRSFCRIAGESPRQYRQDSRAMPENVITGFH
jgi:AraC-like DNA-binding protein